MNKAKIVHEFPKNPVEIIRASVSNYRGKEYIDLRIFYSAGNGEYQPTKKGLTFSADLINDLEEAVRKLREAVDPA